MNYQEAKALLEKMTPEQLAEVDALLREDKAVWRPQPGPQTMAYESTADIIGYGGAAGGGKTDLLCGKALTQHKRIIIFRREGPQLAGVIDRLEELIGNKDGYNGQKNIWRLPGRQIELGSVPHLGDESAYQGRPHDLIGFDEAANFLEQQIRFLLGWLRSTDPKQRCQCLMTFNPPTSSEGQWVIPFFAPWLDPAHPNPAKPGELRWFAMVDGKEIELPSGETFQHNGRAIKPLSRTFIPSKVTDNPYLAETGYMSVLQSLPEPLRSQMLEGDFRAGMGDDPFQVIPTKWVEIAQARWARPAQLTVMDSMGCDVARGGKDETVIGRRHGMWFDEPLAYPGKDTPDGPTVGGLCIAALRDKAPIHIDVIGVGASPYDFLKGIVQTIGVNVGMASHATDKSGMLFFNNLRSEHWWKFREALDPSNNTGIALPPSSKLKADLTAPKWKLVGKKIVVESRDEIVKRIGRSPDYASAYILALIDTPKEAPAQEPEWRPYGGSGGWMAG